MRWTWRDRERTALELAVRFGGFDGGHHKAWVIDQMVRALTGSRSALGNQELPDPSPEYVVLVADARAGEDGPETYSWDEGTPP